MRKIHFLLAFALIVSLAALSYAQRGSSNNNAGNRMAGEMQRQRQLLKDSQEDLRQLEVNGNNPNRKIDPIIAQQILIELDLKELNSFTDSILFFAHGRNDKEIGNLAEKVAKRSKSLRQHMNISESKKKIAPFPLPPNDDRQLMLKQLAESMDKLVDQVNASQFARVFDATRIQQTAEQLYTIESQALTIRYLTKGKN